MPILWHFQNIDGNWGISLVEILILSKYKLLCLSQQDLLRNNAEHLLPVDINIKSQFYIQENPTKSKMDHQLATDT